MAFSFGSMFSSLKGARGSVIGLDIGSSSVKVVQLSKKGGRVVLDTYGALALGPYANVEIGRATMLSGTKIAEVVKDLFREASITTRNASVAIPLASSLVTMIEMPDLPQKELADMIPIEARKYIPVPISEVMLDWWVIPKADEPSSSYMGKEAGQQGKMVDVLLVVILNEALTKYQEVIKQAEVQSSFYEIEIFSTIRSALDGGGMQPTMVVDFGAATTKLYIIERGVVRASHTVNKGSQDLTFAIGNACSISVAEAENLKRTHGLAGECGGKSIRDIAGTVLQFIFSEANMVLLNYEKKYGKNVSTAMLTGGGSTLKGILEVAKSVFETDVVLGDPFNKVQTPAFMDPVLRQVGPEFAVALGLALRKIMEQDGV